MIYFVTIRSETLGTLYDHPVSACDSFEAVETVLRDAFGNQSIALEVFGPFTVTVKKG